MAQALLAFAISYAISTAISAAFPAEGPRLKDLTVSASTYGNIIPEVWGTVRVGGNMIWSSGIIEHKAEVKAGPGAFYDKYTYSANFAMALCKGPVIGLIRIWANGKLIYDVSGQSKGINNGQYAHVFYNGDIDQMPDPVMQAAVGADSTPAYRGTTYIVFTEFLLTDFGNQIPMIAAEVFKGEDNGVPVVPFTTDGTTTYPQPYSNTQLTVDSIRQRVYMNDENHGLIVFDANTGIHITTTFPAVGTDPLTNDGIGGLIENPYDGTGQFTYVYDIADDGGILTSCGYNVNNVKIVKLDPYGYQMAGSVGHTYPFGTDFDVTLFKDIADGGPYLDSFLVPLPFFGTSSMQGSMFMTNGANGSCFCIYTDFMGLPATGVTPPPYPVNDKGGPFINIGDHTCTKIITADFNEGFIFFHSSGGVAGMSSDTLRIWCISQPVNIGLSWTYQTNLDILIENPDVGSSEFQPRACILDIMTGNLLLAYSNSAQAYVASYSRDTKSFVWVTPLTGGFPSLYQATGVLTNQLAWVGADDRLWLIDTTDGTWVNRDPDVNIYSDPNWLSNSDITFTNPGINGYALPTGTGNAMQYFDGLSGNLYGLAEGAGQFTALIRANAFGSQPALLSDIITDLMLSSGLEPDDFDVSAFITTTVNGYGYASTVDIKGIIAELSQIYLFDFYERDGILVGVMRGGDSSIETISYKALGSQSGGDDDKADYWKEQRLSEADLPASLTLKYLNLDEDYEENTAVSQRIFAPIPTMFSRQSDSVEANIVFDATEAKNRVNAMLYTQWAERTRHKTKLPLAYSYLDPSDLITVNLADGRSYFERIRETEFGADFSTNIETNGQDSGAYIFNLTGDGGDGQGQTLNPPVPAYPMIFNTPYLRDGDAGGDGKFSIFYDGTANLVPNDFNGAVMFESTDGNNYNTIQMFDKDVMWGITKGTIPGPLRGWYALDWDTKIIIYPAVDFFTLSSITDDELWLGTNMCVIGNEVLQFRDAVNNGDGSWTISNLLRGRRGTEWACDIHNLAEKFTFLDSATISAAQMTLDSGGKDFWFKAVGTGRDISTSIAVEITYEPRDLMPYAPVHLGAVWTSDGLDFTFVRRTRLGGNMVDGTGTVPLIETSEAYELDVYAEDGTTILRTLSVNFGGTPVDDPTIAYTAVQIDEDFDTPPATITFEVYQIGITGRGFGSKATVTITGTPSAVARYWGASVLTSLAESDILALSSDLASNYDKSVVYDCTGGKYPYFCFPETFGTPAAVTVNGLPFTAFDVSVVSVGGANYNVLRFSTIQFGSSISTVWG